MSAPAERPVHQGLLVDAEGNVWAERFTYPTGEQKMWTVYDSTGVVLGSAATPADFSIWQIGSRFVLGITTDEFGVETVLRYELLKPESR
jgi:hypothetical protein